MSDASRDEALGFKETLAAGRFAITAEVTPPVSCDPTDLLRLAAPLRGLVDAVNVTDNPGARTHLGALVSAALLNQNGIEAILQVTCRDRNRIAIESDLLSAAALGLRNLLILRGDDPAARNQTDVKAVFELDTRSLTATARTLRDRGELASGQKVGGRAEFFLGVADIPIDPPPSFVPEGLKAKMAAGAQFVQTQFCMDIDIVRRYIARLSEHGITQQLFVLIGVAPLRSARSARWMREHLFGTIIPERFVERLEQASDPAAEGRRICVELLGELAQVPGVAGAHVMAPNNEAALAEVLSEAGSLRLRPVSQAPTSGV